MLLRELEKNYAILRNEVENASTLNEKIRI